MWLSTWHHAFNHHQRVMWRFQPPKSDVTNLSMKEWCDSFAHERVIWCFHSRKNDVTLLPTKEWCDSLTHERVMWCFQPRKSDVALSTMKERCDAFNHERVMWCFQPWKNDVALSTMKEQCDAFNHEAVMRQCVIVMRGRFAAQKSLALDLDIMVEVHINMKEWAKCFGTLRTAHVNSI